MKKLMFLWAVLALTVSTAAASTLCGGPEGHADKKKSCAPAEQKKTGAETPTMSELRTITVDELRGLLSAGTATVLDARSEAQFTAGHIDGAVHAANATLPADKSATLVFYCGGVKCPAAARAARKALEQGYTNVLVYSGGWAEWSATAASNS